VRRRISLNITCRSNNKTRPRAVGRLKGDLGLAEDGRPRYDHHNAIPSYPTLYPYTLNHATIPEHSSPKSYLTQSLEHLVRSINRPGSNRDVDA
jgi:hypothetical protein